MWIVLALALVVGLLLGLMGGGGSILMVPLLTYVAGLEPKQAIAGSLFVVGVTSLVSVLLHSRHGTVRWRTGLIFGAASMVGALLGGVVGFVTGIVGAGGGFLVVPALVLLGGLPMSAAVGTSLLVIAMKSFAGLGGYLTSVTLPWDLLLWVTGVAVVGALIGVPLMKRVPEKALKKGFGWFVLAMGLVILVRELIGLLV